MAIVKPPPKGCPLRETPLEIMEMIFGNVHFSDLAELLLAAKWIRTAFVASRYGVQYQLIRRRQKRTLLWLFDQLDIDANKGIWRVHDVLNAFTDEFCECGNYGWLVFWLASPPKKLCQCCAKKPEYQLTMLKKAMKLYGLKERDVMFVPTTKAIRPKFIIYGFETEFEANSTLAQLSLVKEIARRKGRDVEVLGDPPKPRFKRCFSSRFGFEIRPGFVETPTYDIRQRCAFLPLNCGFCRDRSIKGRIRWGYEPFRVHVACHHPEHLQSFELGWEKMDSSIQKGWEAQCSFSSGLTAISHCPNSKEEFETYACGAWASFRYSWESQHGIPPRDEGLTMAKAQTELRNLISNNMRDSQQLYGLGPVSHFRVPNLWQKAKEKKLCDDIASAAAEAILQAEMSAVLTRWKGLIEEDGLERVAEIYSGAKKEKDQKRKRHAANGFGSDFSDFSD